ncbi:MAG: hypothetical protein IPL65_04130 [Lewinellaceae bacterium]|nr:hypothetical protein [Lewinellaceae bacterium]
MKNDFKETQHFRQPWIYVLLLGINGLLIYGVVQQTLIGQPFGDNPAPTPLLLLFCLIPIAISLLLWFAKLETRIDASGIHFRFWPMLRQERNIRWTDVQHITVRQYKPIREFGGWGVRYGFKGMAYNTSGDMGIEIALKNGKKILLGTQNPEKARHFLKTEASTFFKS